MSRADTEPSPPARDVPRGDDPPPPPPPWAGPAAEEFEPLTSRPRRPVWWGLAMIAAGILWLLSLAGVPIRWELVLPSALIVVGVLVLARPRSDAGGLTGLGIVLLVLTLFTAVLPGAASVSAGDRLHVVADVGDLDEDYSLGAGTLVLDLGDLELTEAAEVSAQVGMGELVVVVPDDVRLEGTARVGLGEVEAFGEATGGVAPTVELGEGDAEATVLTLDLQVGLGQIEVRR
jgi:hypothetical protein